MWVPHTVSAYNNSCMMTGKKDNRDKLKLIKKVKAKTD